MTFLPYYQMFSPKSLRSSRASSRDLLRVLSLSSLLRHSPPSLQTLSLDRLSQTRLVHRRLLLSRRLVSSSLNRRLPLLVMMGQRCRQYHPSRHQQLALRHDTTAHPPFLLRRRLRRLAHRGYLIHNSRNVLRTRSALRNINIDRIMHPVWARPC
jgi:hypothetical protein